MRNILDREMKQRLESSNYSANQRCVCSNLTFCSFRRRTPMPEAALLLAKYIFDGIIEKFGLESEYGAERFNKVTRRIFFTRLAQRNQSRRSRDGFTKVLLRQSLEFSG